MRTVSLFSGIGGLDLGAELAGAVVVLHCEQNDFRRRILAARFPGIPCHDDVRTLEPGALERAGQLPPDGRLRGADAEGGPADAGLGPDERPAADDRPRVPAGRGRDAAEDGGGTHAVATEAEPRGARPAGCSDAGAGDGGGAAAVEPEMGTDSESYLVDGADAVHGEPARGAEGAGGGLEPVGGGDASDDLPRGVRPPHRRLPLPRPLRRRQATGTRRLAAPASTGKSSESFQAALFGPASSSSRMSPASFPLARVVDAESAASFYDGIGSEAVLESCT